MHLFRSNCQENLSQHKHQNILSKGIYPISPVGKEIIKNYKDYMLSIKNLGFSYYNSCSMRKLEDWTLIYDQANLNLKETRVYLPIDDRDLQYTQILFISKGNQYLDYDYDTQDTAYYYSEGFNLHYNYFAFENYNIIIYNAPDDRLFTDISNHPNFKLLPANSLEILQLSTGICRTNKSVQHKYCSTKFTIQIPNDAGRIIGISDLESFLANTIDDNEFNYDFQLYVK